MASEERNAQSDNPEPYRKKYFYITKQIFLNIAETLEQNDVLRNEKRNIDRKHNKFSPGDLIYIKHIPTAETNMKLQPKFTGPYRLIEVEAENIFFVEHFYK